MLCLIILTFKHEKKFWLVLKCIHDLQKKKPYKTKKKQTNKKQKNTKKKIQKNTKKKIQKNPKYL
jgi:hypothetical protein